MNTPLLILNQNAERKKGKEAQQGIITAAKAVADIVCTTLGPCSMLKMLLGPSGGAVLTNDGASILREIEVQHPAAKSIIELSRTQDERVGDGTTSVVVLAGELISAAWPLLSEGMHPTRIVSAYRAAADDAIDLLRNCSQKILIDDRKKIELLAASTLATKFTSRFGLLLPKLASQAVMTVASGYPEGDAPDVKELVKVEKVAGGQVADSQMIDGIMLNKDILHPAMRRLVERPRILLLDCPLEYKKSESEMNIELTTAADWRRYLIIEEEFIRKLCTQIKALKPDVVVCEKGVSDMAQHFLQQVNVSVLRRVRKSDIHRLALASGAKVGSDPSKMTQSDVGEKCGRFEIRKFGDDYWSFFEKCESPGAVSVLLRGGSRELLHEIERNLVDAMSTIRNVLIDPRVLPGGGVSELGIAAGLRAKATTRGESIELRAYLAAASAMEIIPKTLAKNCGAKVSRVLAKLRADHDTAAKKSKFSEMGVNGKKGTVVNITKLGLWDPLAVKEQIVMTAFEAACVLLRIDDILSGVTQSKNNVPAQPSPHMG